MVKRLCSVDKRPIGSVSSNIMIAEAEGRNSYITYDKAVLVGSNEAVRVSSGENANGGPRMEQEGRHKINRRSLENARYLILCLRAQLAP